MSLETVVSRFRDRFTMVVLFTLSVVLPVGCDNPEMILMIEMPTEVHSIDQTSASTFSSSSVSQSENVQPGKVMTTLKAGETARAVGVYHGKDLDAFQVKLADGTEGLILAGDTFKVVSR